MNAECGMRIADWLTLPSHDLAGRRSARGMTLFEVLLVLALLVVLSSFATPVLQGTLATVRLRRGTDQVLADWARARTRAIEEGHVYQFRFSENGNEYRIERWQADESIQEDEFSNSTDDSAATDENSDSQEIEEDHDNESETVSGWHIEAEISETVVFVGGEQAVVDITGSREVETLIDEKSSEWSTPILFFPDGTTSEASILLRNENDRYQRATLRALTGAARASRLLTATEVEDQQAR